MIVCMHVMLFMVIIVIVAQIFLFLFFFCFVQRVFALLRRITIESAQLVVAHSLPSARGKGRLILTMSKYRYELHSSQ
jgi:hypothetical protein